MQKMKDELKIDLQSTTLGNQVSGSLEEIQKSHEFLQDSLHGSPGCHFLLEGEVHLERLKIHEQSKDFQGDEIPTVGTDTGGDKGKEAVTTTGHSDDDSSTSQFGHPKRGSKETCDKTEGRIDPQQFGTIPLPLKFIFHLNSQALQDLQLIFDVQIEPSPDHTSVTVSPGKECDAEKFNGACDAFFSYYQGACSGMISEEVTLDLPDGESLDDYSPEDIDVGLPVLIERGPKPSQLVLYGDTASVMAAKERFLSLSILEDSWEFFDNTMVYKTHSDESHSEPREIVQRKTSTGITVSVWKGDITRLKVKAVVNPANSHLHHVAGLARAIAKAGGKSIQKESDSIVHSLGKVNVGRAVHTKAGRLPCEFVIHAVGPEWIVHDEEQCRRLLFDACLESLRIAKDLGLKSIAFPAISSGLFGVPLGVCAGAMLSAVEEYVQANASRKKVLSDIRFVHIDDDAVEIFQKELLQRFLK